MTTLLSTTQTAESQAAISPAEAIKMLKDGNSRFLEGSPIDRALHQQVAATASGQYPFAVVLGCIDSRVPVETLFDQGIGDVFTARVAGNIVNEDLLGSMEFACKLAGSKAILVLGHTSCGAVKGAIGKARMGNLTALVQKIEPVVDQVAANMDSEDPGFTDAVAEANVTRTIQAIRENSEVLAEMEAAGEIAIAGAMYDVGSGQVHFL
jgi:carbonic anhydrase